MGHLPLNVRVPIELDNPSIMRDESLCIKCGMCSNVCEKSIAVHGTYSFLDTNDKAVCINCGQCANVCPVNSITEKYEYLEVKKAIQDPDKIVIFNTSPSVRVALGEEFGLDDGTFVQGKMVALLRALGANYVLDTNFSADLTIMEEASELLERITKNTGPLPQFTSCCPAWVKYVETYYPEMIKNISSAKSPIGMQGPTIKTYFAKKNNLDPKKIVNVALTPCTAKKFEIRREEMNASAAYNNAPEMRDMDYVITTRELAKWAREESIDFKALSDSNYDKLMGEASGAGVIFGNTGGVMEAALRTAYKFITNTEAPIDLLKLTPVRGYEGIREASIDINGLKINVAVCHGTANAKKLIEAIKSGEKNYHFVEVMTCPGGCIGGGGQPKNMLKNMDKVREARIKGLYQKDDSMAIRASHNNPDIIKVYEDFYNKPLSELAEKMLHTFYHDRSYETFIEGKPTHKPEPKKEATTSPTGEKWVCQICGYVHEGPLPEGFVCPDCGVGAEMFELMAPVKPDHEMVKVSEATATTKEIWRCTVCGYEVEGPLPDDFTCPLCGVGKDLFELVTPDDVKLPPKEAAKSTGEKWRCEICGYVHEGPLPEDFVCPDCGMGADMFSLVQEAEKPIEESTPASSTGERYRCLICGYIHEGPLSEGFTCPDCGMGADMFEKIN